MQNRWSATRRTPANLTEPDRPRDPCGMKWVIQPVRLRTHSVSREGPRRVT